MESNKITFRFDDVSGNVDSNKFFNIIRLIREKFSDSEILVGISPFAHKNCGERVFPSILNAYSDYRKFYEVDIVTSVDAVANLTYASHGLIHIDHRHLCRQTQEMSILVSCSLTKSKIFIPPFNKWNADTESICAEHGIELIKWEDGWLSAEHNQFDPEHNLWYLHPYAWTVESFKEWLGGKNES